MPLNQLAGFSYDTGRKSFILDNGQAMVALYGPGISAEDLRDLAVETDSTVAADQVCFVKTPNDETERGFGYIVMPTYGDGPLPDFYAEGVKLTTSGSAIIFQTADGPTLVLYEETTHRLVATHAGRAALTPRVITFRDESGTRQLEPMNIIDKAYGWLTAGIIKPRVTAYVTGAICAKHFPHNKRGARSLVQPFLEFSGPSVFKNVRLGTLDLKTVIARSLKEKDWRISSVIDDGLCTYEEEWLASYRRDPGTTERNTVVVVLR